MAWSDDLIGPSQSGNRLAHGLLRGGENCRGEGSEIGEAILIHEFEQFGAADRVQTDNMLAIIYAERGNRDEARRIWTELVHSTPASTEAVTNLAILDRLEGSNSLKRSTVGIRTSAVWRLLP